MTDLFMQATRNAYRYPSVRGDLTTEQLWQLPLLASKVYVDGAFDLDTVARKINAELKAMGEESFVEKENPNRAIAAAKLEVVKAVIATKQAEAKANEARIAKAGRRRELLDALEMRNRQELSQASKDELEKQLAALDAD